MAYLLETHWHLLLIALALDIIFGDPVYRFHPIRLCGSLLTFYENKLRERNMATYQGGVILFLVLAATSCGIVISIEWLTLQIHPLLHTAWHIYAVWSLIALGDLCRHGYRVAKAARNNNLKEARHKVSMLVGRDTDKMSLADCCRAAIESISENLTDGVLSPLFYYILFGLPGLVLFKIISTMDSMVGYKNERYREMGWCGARLDDLLNFIPARISWLLITVAAALFSSMNARAAFYTGLKQHNKLPSPNSGWSEATAAGALGLKLVGPTWRKGKLTESEWMGPTNGSRDATAIDIKRMIALAIASTILAAILGFLLSFVALITDSSPTTNLSLSSRSPTQTRI